MSDNDLGFWGNDSCVQCGACCVEYNNNHMSNIESGNANVCEHFEVKGGKAYCGIHKQERESICERFFCGVVDTWDKRQGVGRIHKIANILKTTPTKYD